MRVDKQMTTDVITCGTGDSAARAAKLLWDHDCGILPVVDHRGRVQGMITDRDICMAALITGKSLADLHVRDAMAKDVASTRPSESIHEAEMVMRDRRVRRLPVLDSQNRLVGMLSCNDLLRWIDDGGANGTAVGDAVHLVHTLAAVGRSRAAKPRVVRSPTAEMASHHEPGFLGPVDSKPFSSAPIRSAPGSDPRE